MRPEDAAAAEGIARAYEHAGDEWAEIAATAIRHVAEREYTFTTDDVQAVLDLAGIPAPDEGRAWGGAMRRAAREGVIAPTDTTRKSTQVRCHGRKKAVWLSLVYGGVERTARNERGIL